MFQLVSICIIFDCVSVVIDCDAHLLLQLKWSRWSLTSWSFTLSQSWLLRSGWWMTPQDMFRSDIILKRLALLPYHNRQMSALFSVQVWRIEDLELKEVNPSTYGQFYGGDCYLVLYTYNRANKPQYILYMWQVRSTTCTLYLQHDVHWS